MAVRILHNQSNTSYHADLALGSTYIKDWHLRSPRHAEHGVKTINRYTADEGTAAHFEFSNDGDLVIMAGETRRGVRWEEAQAQAEAIGGVALPIKAYKNATSAGRSARAHPFVQQLLSNDPDDIWFETSIFADHATGLSIKTRPDLYMPKSGLLLDLKTTISAAPENFTKTIFNMGYDKQAAFYRLVCREAGLRVDDEFHFIAVEKTSPFVTQHFVLEGDSLAKAEERVEQILHEIAQARNTGEYSTGWPPVSKINLSNTKEFLYE